MASIATTTNHADASDILNALLTDLTAVRAAVVAITAKLVLDAGITDTDYAATTDPAALTTLV